MTIMNIPKTTGYTEIVKIVEAALDLDRDKAIKYINKFIIKFPESDLIYPFTHLLKRNKNPSGLGHGDIIHTSHPTTLPSDEEIKAKAINNLMHIESPASDGLEFSTAEENIAIEAYTDGAKDMRSLCEAKIAEMEREMKEVKQFISDVMNFADGIKVLDGEALQVLKNTARRVLSDKPTQFPRK